MIREHNDRMQAVHLGAQLTAYAPAKGRDFTKLKKLLISETPKVARRQTWQEQLAVAQQWTALSRR